MMPLPEDEKTWGDLFVLFATSSGNVRRNSLSDFSNVMANGKIAMKLNPGDKLVRVRTCSETDDVLLSAKAGKVIRFPVTAVRVFSGRSSTGVRGIKLRDNDEVIAMSLVRHNKVETKQRDLYLQAVSAARRLKGGDYTGRSDDKARDEELASRLDKTEYRAMAEEEEFILTITEDGMGKRTSAYEYRIAGRGGQGITGIELSRGNSQTASSIVAAFTVLDSDQLVMVSDTGQIIRCPIDKVSVIGRSGRGVSIFKVEESERLVSVSRIRDLVDDNDEEIQNPSTDVDLTNHNVKNGKEEAKSVKDGATLESSGDNK